MDPTYSSIPPNVVAAVEVTMVGDIGPPGARRRDAPQCVVCALVKNGRSLLVQCRGIQLLPREELMVLSFEDQQKNSKRNQKDFTERLTAVASLIDTIAFEKYQYAFLVDGLSPRLVGYPQEGVSPITAPSGWLPRVRESDMKAIQWMSDRVRCVWNGRQVEVFLPHSFTERWRIQQTIDILYRFHQLEIDITYEPLALVIRDTEILGLVMERTEGRPIGMQDRTLLYDVFARLHKENIVYESPVNFHSVLIQDGKLRFTLCLHSFVQHDPDGPEREYFEKYTWNELDELFRQLPQWTDLSFLKQDSFGKRPTLLNYISDPEHPLSFDFNLYPNRINDMFHHIAQTLVPKAQESHHRVNARSDSRVILARVSSNPNVLRIVSHRIPAYHPYRSITNKKILLLSESDSLNPSAMLSRADVSRIHREGSIASHGTVVDVDDDATIVAEEDRWTSKRSRKITDHW